MRVFARLALLVVLLYSAAAAYRIQSRKYYIWLPDYVRRIFSRSEPPGSPTHIFFLYTDHFEPSSHHHRVVRWEREYPTLANRHRDSTGRPVQHSWFYPGEQIDPINLKALQGLVSGGFGEVEFHYHHTGDTNESARDKFRRAIEEFQRYGFLKTIRGDTRFGFIHGNWALDNSDPNWCGANQELRMLRELGAYADFTFPAIYGDSQPAMINSIFDAADDARPKSYNRGVPLRVGRPRSGDLLIFEGPLLAVPSWTARHLFWDVEDGNIHPTVPLTEARVDAWISANIHVEGKPEWVFVKVHGHAASSDAEVDEALGLPFERVLTHLETRYNDGRRFVLHYITAREAYNLVRAAAAGQTGSPTSLLDWEVAPYAADPARGETPRPKP